MILVKSMDLEMLKWLVPAEIIIPETTLHQEVSLSMNFNQKQSMQISLTIDDGLGKYDEDNRLAFNDKIQIYKLMLQLHAKLKEQPELEADVQLLAAEVSKWPVSVIETMSRIIDGHEAELKLKS